MTNFKTFINEIALGSKKNKGFTLLVAIIVTSMLLAIGFSISSIILNELLLSSNGENSQYAFYAADSGGECALYWDRNATTTSTGSAFATSSGSVIGVDALDLSTISCNGHPLHPELALTSYSLYSATTSFYINLGTSTCALVSVYRDKTVTQIDSRGYNRGVSGTGACDTSDPRTVERGLRITF